MARTEDVVGRTTDEAVETIVARDQTREPDAVRRALDPVTEDGVVTEAAVESTVSDTSKVVATAETRVELAGIAYESACETADGVADLGVVASRLDDVTDRLDAVESRLADLQVDLRRPVGRLEDASAVYELAVELREVASAAQGVVRTADGLQLDLEQVETWVRRPAVRYDEFREDVEFTEGALDDLEAAAAGIPESADTPANEWADAVMRVRVTDLLLADLRAELDDLREWAEREDDPFRESLASDLDALRERRRGLAARLDDVARPAWVDRFDGRLSDLDELEPPVDWGTVERTYETHRGRVLDDG